MVSCFLVQNHSQGKPSSLFLAVSSLGNFDATSLCSVLRSLGTHQGSGSQAALRAVHPGHRELGFLGEGPLPRGEENRRVAQVRNVGREARLRSWRAEASVGTGRPTSLPVAAHVAKLLGSVGRVRAQTAPLGVACYLEGEMPSQ